MLPLDIGGGPIIQRVQISRVDYANDTAIWHCIKEIFLLCLGNSVSARECGFVPIGPAVVANAPVQNVPAGAGLS